MLNRRALAAIALGLAPTLAAAQGTPSTAAQAPVQAPAPSPDVQRTMVAAKIELAERLVNDSPAATRIAASQNEKAKALFAEGVGKFRDAQMAIARNDLAAADQAAGQALWAIGQARQLVPDDMRRVIQERVRYSALLLSTEGLLASYQRHRAQLAPNAPDTDAVKAIERMDGAKLLANSERIADANRMLAEAEASLLVAINRLLGSATLDYAPRFDTPAQELAFELDRYRGFTDLVPLALRELNPRPEARALVDRYVEHGRTLRAAAESLAAQQNYPAALAAAREAIAQAQRALTSAGLVVPQ
jgi:hypothetical protein